MSRPSEVKLIIDQLREKVPGLPKDFGALYRLLCAVRNYTLARSAGKQPLPGRGRPRQYPIERLETVYGALSEILDAATHGRISVRSFIDNQLRIMKCPRDVRSWCEDRTLSIQEGLLLSRVTSHRVGSEDLATSMRYELYRWQMKERAPLRKFVLRVKQALDSVGGESDQLPAQFWHQGDGSEIDISLREPFGGSELFAEQIRFLIALLHEVEVSDIPESDVDLILETLSDSAQVIYRILKKYNRVPLNP